VSVVIDYDQGKQILVIRCDFCEDWEGGRTPKKGTRIRSPRSHRFPPDVNPNCVPDGWLYIERPLPYPIEEKSGLNRHVRIHHPKHVCPTCVKTELPE
jgi:hypothetical protein